MEIKNDLKKSLEYVKNVQSNQKNIDLRKVIKNERIDEPQYYMKVINMQKHENYVISCLKIFQGIVILFLPYQL